MVLVATGLGGCSNDDEYVGEDVYQGYIQRIYGDSGITIRITKSPFNAGIEMPSKNELIDVILSDFPNSELKVQQKLAFRIISAESLFHPFLLQEYSEWRCKIEIFKIY